MFLHVATPPPFVARIPLQTSPSPPPSTRSPSTCPNKPAAALPNSFPRARIRRFVTRPQVLPSVRRAAGFQRVRRVGAMCGRACRSLTVGSSEGRMLRQLQKRRQASKRPPAGAPTRMNSEYWLCSMLMLEFKLKTADPRPVVRALLEIKKQFLDVSIVDQ